MREIIFPDINEIKGPPKIEKHGFITDHGAEMSLFVYKNRLMYMDVDNLRCIDYFTKEAFSPIADSKNTYYLSAFCENDIVYAFATKDNKVYRFVTENLDEWTEGEVVIEFPENFELFNTSVCKAENEYVMAIEAGGADDRFPDRNDRPNPYIGKRFTEFFAISKDLKNWALMDFDKGYTKLRYNACPSLSYSKGYFYMICLEELPLRRYAPYIYRTKDFETWEIGFYNPLFIPSREDLYPKNPDEFPPEICDMNFKHLNTNNSDVDVCEYNGKTYIVYCSGNQGNTWGGQNCEAVFNGTLDEFLASNFE